MSPGYDDQARPASHQCDKPLAHHPDHKRIRAPLTPQRACRVYQQPHAAALPCCAEHLRDRCLDALVGIGDDELDPSQAATGELAKQCGPEGLGVSDLLCKLYRGLWIAVSAR